MMNNQQDCPTQKAWHSMEIKYFFVLGRCVWICFKVILPRGFSSPSTTKVLQMFFMRKQYFLILLDKLLMGNIMLSVTRLGKILPLGQTFKNICQTFEGLYSVWQNFEPTFAKMVLTFGQIWAIVSSQIIKNNLAKWSHTDHAMGS